jgi:hypothetical protein
MVVHRKKSTPLFLGMDLERKSYKLQCHTCVVLPEIPVAHSVTRDSTLSQVTVDLAFKCLSVSVGIL